MIPRSAIWIAYLIDRALRSWRPRSSRCWRRLIPVVVDATLHHLLWTLEHWPEVHLGVTLPVEAVSDVRQVALGALQGYLYDWIPRFSQEAHDLTTLEQGEP